MGSRPSSLNASNKRSSVTLCSYRQRTRRQSSQTARMGVATERTTEFFRERADVCSCANKKFNRDDGKPRILIERYTVKDCLVDGNFTLRQIDFTPFARISVKALAFNLDS